jgi:glutathione S-transferase
MITLYVSNSYFGLPDPSPFVTKAEMLFKLAGIDYRVEEMSFSKAPKGKVPYIGDDGVLLGDSLFIRRHLEQRYGADFSGGYSAREQSLAWSIERMLEEHFYWLIVHDRWAVDANFEKGPRHFFEKAPAPIRPAVAWFIRRKVLAALHAQGTARHGDEDRAVLAKGDIDSLAALMGERRYLLGDRPCGADATVFSFLLGALCPAFDSDMRRHIETKPGLVAYVARMKAEFYPDFSFAKAA